MIMDARTNHHRALHALTREDLDIRPMGQRIEFMFQSIKSKFQRIESLHQRSVPMR